MKFNQTEALVSEYIALSSVKNRVIQYWPKKTVNGTTEVFDELLFYDNVVIETDEALRIYKILDITVDELKEESYDGIDKAYFRFKPDDDILIQMSGYNITDYINKAYAQWNTETIQERVVEVSAYQTAKSLNYPESIDARDMTAMVKARPSVLLFDKEDAENKIVSLVLNDTTNEMFQWEITAIRFKREFTVQEGQTYTFTGHLKYTRNDMIKDASYVYPSYASNDYIDRLYNQSGDMYTQIQYIHRQYIEMMDTDLYVYETLATGTDNTTSETIYETTGYLKVEAAKKVKAKDFPDIVMGLLDNKIVKKKASGWTKLISGVLVFAAIVLTIASAGTGAVPASVVVSAITIATVVTIGASYYYASKGKYADAQVWGHTSQTLGYIGMVNAWLGAMKKKIAEEAAKKTAQQTMTSVIQNMSFTQMINYASSGFGLYSQWEMRRQRSQTNAMQEKIEDQEDELDDLPTQKKYEMELYDFETYNFIDLNEKMDTMVYEKTQGKIDNAMGKYF